MSKKQNDNYKEKYLMITYEDEMKKSYIDYAMSVIVGRALPDVRDGLKPVHRRILFAMAQLGLLPEKAYRKSARVVGDVLGKYHPHGDASVYDAMVRMAQEFRMGMTLVDGHGNFGSIDGDSAAAMRYTEAKLTELATEMLKDLEKDVIDFKENFDGSEKEPEVLPAKFPNLLINGSNGIAVGMATNIPPHNPIEVIDAIIAYIDNSKITIEQILEYYIKGPDYPSGAIIINKDEMLDFYKTGKGKVIIRSKVEMENAGYGRTNIVITEIPYTYSGNKTKLINNIIDLVNDKTLDEIVDVRDESSREGIRIVLEVKKGVDLENLLNLIYEKTGLQDDDSYNFLVIDNSDPVVINLLTYFKYYVDFQKEITQRKYKFLLEKAEKRAEVLEGLVRATDVIDEIIEAIRGSKTLQMVRDCLMFGKTDEIKFKTKKCEKVAKTFNFTERQAKAILDTPLHGLIGLEIEKLNKEYEELKAEIAEYKDIVTNEKKQLSVIKKYLKEYKGKFAVERKTEITNIKVVKHKKEFKEEELNILVDKFGYVKTVDTISLGRSSEDTLSEFKYNILSKNTDKLAVFTNKGNLYQIKMLDVPSGKPKDKGTPVETLCNMSKGEYPVRITTWNNMKDNILVLITKSGLIKKSECSEFETKRALVASTKLDENDEVTDIKIIEPENEKIFKEVAVTTKDGLAIRFSLGEVPVLKKNSKGVKIMEGIEDKDMAEQLFLIPKKDPVITKINGKEVDLQTLAKKTRGKKGTRL